MFGRAIWGKLPESIFENFENARVYNPNYKLLKGYYKLQQKFITNYGSFITNYGNNLLQFTKKKQLRQLLFLQNSKLLQITSSFITNCDNF